MNHVPLQTFNPLSKNNTSIKIRITSYTSSYRALSMDDLNYIFHIYTGELNPSGEQGLDVIKKPINLFRAFKIVYKQRFLFFAIVNS